MRDWRSYWRGRTVASGDNRDDALREVGKTVLGTPISQDQVDLIVESILCSLDLSAVDQVIDLGCGNGILTYQVAAHVANIIGFDISEPLIEAANRRCRLANCAFFVGDILDFDPSRLTTHGPYKIFTYEVFQHLSTEEGKYILDRIFSQARQETSFFAGSVPDQAKLGMFYNTPERQRLYQGNVRNNSEQIGHWWSREEINTISHELGIRCAFVEQDPRLYTAHYRFNVMFNG